LPKPTRRRKIVDTDTEIVTFISFVCGKDVSTQGDVLAVHEVPPVPALVKPLRAASTSAALIASGWSPGRYATPASAAAAAARSSWLLVR